MIPVHPVREKKVHEDVVFDARRVSASDDRTKKLGEIAVLEQTARVNDGSTVSDTAEYLTDFEKSLIECDFSI